VPHLPSSLDHGPSFPVDAEELADIHRSPEDEPGPSRVARVDVIQSHQYQALKTLHAAHQLVIRRHQSLYRGYVAFHARFHRRVHLEPARVEIRIQLLQADSQIEDGSRNPRWTDLAQFRQVKDGSSDKIIVLGGQSMQQQP
jgi:hypothetical protein